MDTDGTAQDAPHVSVVIPCFNAAEQIEETLASVIAQEGVSLEAVCVDDGSTDETVARVEAVAGKDNRVRLLRHPGGVNRGVSRTRALAIESSRGEYIAFLDADDLMESGRLLNQVEAMRSTGAVACHSRIRAFGDGTAREFEGVERSYDFRTGDEPCTYRFLAEPDVLSVLPILISTAMVRGDVLRETPIALDQLFQTEDWVMWLLLAAKGPFHYLPDRLTAYRIHAGQYNKQVRGKEAKRVLSRLEFLLAVLARVDEEAVRTDAVEELRKAIVHGVAHYGGGDSSWIPRQVPIRLEADEIDARQWRHRAEVAEHNLAKLRASRIVRLTESLRKMARRLTGRA